MERRSQRIFFCALAVIALLCEDEVDGWFGRRRRRRWSPPPPQDCTVGGESLTVERCYKFFSKLKDDSIFSLTFVPSSFLG